MESKISDTIYEGDTGRDQSNDQKRRIKDFFKHRALQWEKCHNNEKPKNSKGKGIQLDILPDDDLEALEAEPEEQD